MMGGVIYEYIKNKHMQLSKRKRRWISIGVGVVGLVTIVGLSDLLFLLPQQTPRVPVAQTPQQNTPISENQTPTTTTTPEKPIPQKETNASGTLEFSL